MQNHTNFLRGKAAALRDLAQKVPGIAADLHRLADELDAKAAELDRHKDDPENAGAP